MLTNKQMDDLLIKAFDNLDRSRETAKVLSSQAMLVSDTNQTSQLALRSLEVVDAADLTKMFIINRSPSIKNSINFMMKVLRDNINEAKKHKNDKECKDIACFGIDVHNSTIDVLQNVNSNLK